MKKEKMITILSALLFVTLTTLTVAQEKTKPEKKIKIRTISVVNGEDIKWDTTFKMDEDQDQDIDIDAMLKKRFPELDSVKSKNIYLHLNSSSEKLKGLQIENLGKMYEYTASICGNDHEKLINVVIDDLDSLHSIHKICDNLIMTDDLEKDFHFLHKDLDNLKYEIHTMIDDGLKHKINVKVLNNIKEHVGDLAYVFHHGEDFDFEDFDFHKMKDFYIGLIASDELNEDDLKILKKSGIKINDDKLDLSNVYLYSGDDDLFDLKFRLKTKGKTVIKIVDEKGEEIFSDKVQYFPGTYDKQTKINMNKKGLYYIYIEQNGQTYAVKLKLD